MVAEGAGVDACSHPLLSNKMGRVFLLSLEDVMGRGALNVALNQAGLRHLIGSYPPATLTLGWHFDDAAALLQAVETLHGEPHGRSLAIRAGRASFYYLKDDIRAVLGDPLGGLGFVPRVRAGLRAIAELYAKTGEQPVRVEETATQFLFHVQRCPACTGRTADTPICRTEVGLLREATCWISGGRHAIVEEVQCLAQGSPSCTYAVEKRPRT